MSTIHELPDGKFNSEAELCAAIERQLGEVLTHAPAERSAVAARVARVVWPLTLVDVLVTLRNVPQGVPLSFLDDALRIMQARTRDALMRCAILELCRIEVDARPPARAQTRVTSRS